VRLHPMGSQPDMELLSPDQLRVDIDLSKSMPGKQETGISADNIRLPKRVRLQDSVPSILVLTPASIVGQGMIIKP
jgi:hypothetical protein